MTDIVDVLTWTVVPALPGTRIEWKADWCDTGSVAVHAWLFKVDVLAENRDEHNPDTSCVTGQPMVLNAQGQLQVVRFVDLEGKPGDILEPT